MTITSELSYKEFELKVQKILWDNVKRQTEDQLKQNFQELIGKTVYEEIKQIGGDELLRLTYYFKLVGNLDELKQNDIFKVNGKEEK